MDPNLDITTPDGLAALVELIDALVSESRPWREKRDALLAQASDEQKLSLTEFAAWFEE